MNSIGGRKLPKVDPKWAENEEYYEDVQGLLDRSGSLAFP